jgi:hypothetical protein
MWQQADGGWPNTKAITRADGEHHASCPAKMKSDRRRVVDTGLVNLRVRYKRR